MKLILFFILFFSIIYVAKATDTIPPFGTVGKTELNINTCEYDPDTDVIYLLDIADANISTSLEMVTVHHKRIKILKQAGLRHANIKLRYYSGNDYQTIDMVEGYTYNQGTNGEVETVHLEPSMVFDKKIDKEFSELSFAMSGAKIGSVIEFRYRIIKRRGYIGLDDWYFQKEDAVRYSSYSIENPTSLIYTMQIVNRQHVEVIKPTTKDPRYTFIMQNIPGLRNEPFQAALSDYIQRLDFQVTSYYEPGGIKRDLVNTWPKLIDEVMNHEFIGFQIKKNIPAPDLTTLVSKATDEVGKMAIIYKYVQQNMDWNGQNSKYSDEGIKKAWDKKRGNVADINLMLLSLLKAAGITAYPCLVSTKPNGKINTEFPFLGQFDALYAYVTIAGKPHLLNASDKKNSPDLIPPEVLYTYGFVTDKKAGGFVSLTSYDHGFTQNTNLRLLVGDDGSIGGVANVTAFDYAKHDNLYSFTKQKVQKELAANDNIDIKVDSVIATGLKDDAAPLDANIYFSGNIKSSGSYVFLPYTLFSGLGQNPFVAEKRQTDIDFGTIQQYNISGSFTIPDTYSFEELPPNISMLMTDTSITLRRITQKQGNTCQFKITLNRNRPQYATEEYPDLKAFYTKLFSLLNEQIVIKKKK